MDGSLRGLDMVDGSLGGLCIVNGFFRELLMNGSLRGLHTVDTNHTSEWIS